jgi:hypothetical protein
VIRDKMIIEQRQSVLSLLSPAYRSAMRQETHGFILPQAEAKASRPLIDTAHLSAKIAGSLVPNACGGWSIDTRLFPIVLSMTRRRAREV